MKKVITLLVVLTLCVAVAIPAVAAGTFVGSPNKDTTADHANTEFNCNDTVPEDVKAQVEALTDLDSCVVVTSVKQAEDKTTDISQEARDLLLEVYEKIVDGSMELDLDGEYVIRDLVDVSFKYEACELQEGHGNKPALLKEPGVTLSVDFALGVASDEELVVLTYIDGKWELIEEVINNGDGSVTCVFEDICPVAFTVAG